MKFFNLILLFSSSELKFFRGPVKNYWPLTLKEFSLENLFDAFVKME
jgi:hypothetical protein